MQRHTYLVTKWQVRQGHATDFEEAWQDIGNATHRLPTPWQEALLLRSTPLLYHGVEVWESVDALAKARATTEYQLAMQAAAAHCVDVAQATAQVVAHVGPGRVEPRPLAPEALVPRPLRRATPRVTGRREEE